MGIITLSIDDELERQVRDRISQMGGFSKGALSNAFEEAIRLWVAGRTYRVASDSGRKFRAVKERRVLAEARTLKELVEELRKSNVDPRDVQILSSTQRTETRRLGMRTVARRHTRSGKG